MGVIAKRPIANVAWRYGSSPPENNYHKSYWERLSKLDYPFLQPGSDADADAVSIALRFTLAQAAVTTAIVGTTKPDRWKQNAALLDAGPLLPDEIQAIRDRWRAVAGTDWVGQG
jgi:aryl-alcohol dehydrogenase-like predicted oxidoreductase